MAHSIPKRNVHIPAAANAPHISLHNLIRKAGGGGGLISCWCWNVEMLPAATGVTIIRGEATLGCPGWLQVQVGLYCYVLILGLARVGGVVLLWAGGASCGKCMVDIPRCWGHCLLDITQLGRAGAWPPHHQPGDSSILEF